MITVKIYLVGLIAIWSTDSATTLVLRDVPTCARIDGQPVEPHIPQVWWDARCEGADCDSGRSRAFERCGDVDETWEEVEDVWLLDGETLQLSGRFSAGERPERRRIAQLSQLVNRAESADFDDSQLARPRENGIVAQWRLEGATVEACHLVSLPQGVALVRFERGGDARRFHPVADVAVLEFTVPEEDLPLRLTAGSNGATRTVELSPEGDGPISIVVSNQPPGLRQRSLTGLHFDLYYELSKRPPTRRQRRRIPRVGGFDSRVGEYVHACAAGPPDPTLERVVDGYTRARRRGYGLHNLGNRPMCPLAEY